MARVAIIGGTGLESLPGEWKLEPLSVKTPFGTSSIVEARREDLTILFVSRHGENHALAPHQVHYQANIEALRKLGAERVLATNAVGSLRLDLEPGALVAFDDFIDFTHGRGVSFWEGHPDRPHGVVHTDFSRPYCPALRDVLLEAAAALDLPLLPRGTYVCANGPRFESPAEIRMFAQWAGDVVGMTGLPEAVFAREAGLCYAAIGIVTNFAAGLTPEQVDHTAVVARMATQVKQVQSLLLGAAVRVSSRRCQTCRSTSSLPAGSDLRPTAL